MERQVILDKLSEFLMVEQGGFQLYRVASERTQMPEFKARYEEFGRETARHREILVGLIEAMGGDPGYVSPLARVAQKRGEQLLCLAIEMDGLSQKEIEAIDLENVLIAETKDYSDWSLLAQLMEQMPEGGERTAVEAAVNEVLGQEDEHLGWAGQELTRLSLQMAMEGPAPSPERWEKLWSGPHYTPDQHPAPVTQGDGLMEPAMLPSWGDSPLQRSMKMTAGRR